MGVKFLKNEDSSELTNAVEKAQATGDPNDFKLIIQLTQDQLYRFLIYTTKSEVLAQDISQEAYIKAIKKINKLKETDKFLPWLFKISKNIYLDHIKSAKNQPMLEINDLDPKILSEEASEREDLQLLLKALDCISELDRYIVLLIHLEGYSYEEAAEITGVSVGALKLKLHRAKKDLLDFLKKDETNE